ncbi:hypothetical protein FAI40_04490 [Acetobacteraceae bacterium]|nr:hypothetical protein FAI40_04490 [Acetobacteraceae bacterium]
MYLEDERLTPKGLEIAGQALFGKERWKSPLASILGLQSSRIRDVVRGARPSPVGWTEDILKALEEQSQRCLEAKEALEKEMKKERE